MVALSSLQALLILAAEGAHHLPQAGEHAAALGPQKVVTSSILWLIPLFPLLGSAINAFAGHYIQRRWGKKYVSAIAIGAMAASFAPALIVCIQLIPLPPSTPSLSHFFRTIST